MSVQVQFLKAMANPVRLKIIGLLLDGEKCVCEIIPYTGRSQSTTSIHLSTLEKTGIVSSRRDGKKVMYRIADDRAALVLKALGTP